MIYKVKSEVFEWLIKQKDMMSFDGDRALICQREFTAKLVNGAKIDLDAGDVVELVEGK